MTDPDYYILPLILDCADDDARILLFQRPVQHITTARCRKRCKKHVKLNMSQKKTKKANRETMARAYHLLNM